MRNFDRGNKFGGARGGNDFHKKSFGDRPRFGGGRDSERPAMHQAVCAKCDKECEVPFRPVDGRPVFCNACFRQQDNGGFGGEAKSFGKPSFQERRPRFEERRPSFADTNNGMNKNTDQFKAQFDILNAKLDQLLKALKPVAPVEVATYQPEEKEEVKPAKIAKDGLGKIKTATKKVAAKKKKK